MYDADAPLRGALGGGVGRGEAAGAGEESGGTREGKAGGAGKTRARGESRAEARERKNQKCRKRREGSITKGEVVEKRGERDAEQRSGCRHIRREVKEAGVAGEKAK